MQISVSRVSLFLAARIVRFFFATALIHHPIDAVLVLLSQDTRLTTPSSHSSVNDLGVVESYDSELFNTTRSRSTRKKKK